MNKTVAISEETFQHLENLPVEAPDMETKIQALIEAEYQRQLARHSLTDRRFRQKYGMSFDDFEARDIEQERGYSWEVESDAMAWETAVDGQQTVKRKLQALLGSRHVPH